MFMLPASVRPSSSDGHSPGSPALARNDYGSLTPASTFRFKNKRTQCVIIHSAAAKRSQIHSQPFFGSVKETLPGDCIENIGRLLG
jgi:hypothetical protein